jgi:Flp pilus assembly pilin Flp
MDCLNRLCVRFAATLRRERGVTLVEYGFVLLLVVAVIVLMLKMVGMRTFNMYSTINASVPNP